MFVWQRGPRGPESYTKVLPTRRGGYELYPLAGASGLHGAAGAKSAYYSVSEHNAQLFCESNDRE